MSPPKAIAARPPPPGRTRRSARGRCARRRPRRPAPRTRARCRATTITEDRSTDRSRSRVASYWRSWRRRRRREEAVEGPAAEPEQPELLRRGRVDRDPVGVLRVARGGLHLGRVAVLPHGALAQQPVRGAPGAAQHERSPPLETEQQADRGDARQQRDEPLGDEVHRDRQGRTHHPRVELARHLQVTGQRRVLEVAHARRLDARGGQLVVEPRRGAIPEVVAEDGVQRHEHLQDHEGDPQRDERAPPAIGRPAPRRSATPMATANPAGSTPRRDERSPTSSRPSGGPPATGRGRGRPPGAPPGARSRLTVRSIAPRLTTPTASAVGRRFLGSRLLGLLAAGPRRVGRGLWRRGALVRGRRGRRRRARRRSGGTGRGRRRPAHRPGWPPPRVTVTTDPLMWTLSTPPAANSRRASSSPVFFEQLGRRLGVALVPHARERAVGLEPQHGGVARRLLDDGDRLAHGGATLPFGGRPAGIPTGAGGGLDGDHGQRHGDHRQPDVHDHEGSAVAARARCRAAARARRSRSRPPARRLRPRVARAVRAPPTPRGRQGRSSTARSRSATRCRRRSDRRRRGCCRSGSSTRRPSRPPDARAAWHGRVALGGT